MMQYNQLERAFWAAFPMRMVILARWHAADATIGRASHASPRASALKLRAEEFADQKQNLIFILIYRSI